MPVEEDGTSRTCGLCGTWKPDLGGNKTFRCDNAACGVVMDRDVNGARNNLLCAYTRTMGVPRGQYTAAPFRDHLSTNRGYAGLRINNHM